MPRDTVYVNDTLKIKSDGVVRIDDPSHRRHRIIPEMGKAYFTKTTLPGIYSIKGTKQGEKWLAVNINPSESVSKRLSEDRIKSIFTNIPYVKINIRRDLTKEVLRPRPLWHYLFLCALVLALMESLICLPKRWKRA